MQRWYEKAHIAKQPAGWVVFLDDKILSTPAGVALLLPTAALAAAVAAEWQLVEKTITPAQMPLTQLAMTQQDKIAPQRDVVVQALGNFLPTELICFYSPQAELLVRQRAMWALFHAWLQQAYGVALPVTTGLTALPATDSEWLQTALQNLSAAELTVCSAVADLLGSIIIPLALVQGVVDAAAALAAAEVEADFQSEKYGADAALGAARAMKAQELASYILYLALAKDLLEG